MIISLISAIAKNRAIGKDNKLLWDLPDDMRRFREITAGKPVIMGRKTYESIGRPLANRKNIILAYKKNFDAPGCEIGTTIKDVLKLAEGSEEVMIIGGGQVYTLFLPLAKRMYLTIVDKEFEGDTFFPEYDEKEWKITKKSDGTDPKSGLKYSFVDFERK